MTKEEYEALRSKYVPVIGEYRFREICALEAYKKRFGHELPYYPGVGFNIQPLDAAMMCLKRGTPFKPADVPPDPPADVDL